MTLVIKYSSLINNISIKNSISLINISLFCLTLEKKKKIKIIYLAGGCFWCTEAIFQNIKGVIEVKPGYIDGTVKNPSYAQVCTGKTGHTEAIELKYNPKNIGINDIFFIFFNTHDPTTLNRQGNDLGTQYRSGIYYTEVKQKQVAFEIIKQINSEKIYDNPIVTEVKKATPFYIAEEHINYYNQNSNQAYCSYTITPKINKLKKYFKNYIDTKK